MARVQCKSCGGEYEDLLADGMRYFHVCPPLSAPEARAAIVDGTVQLSAATAKRLANARTIDAEQAALGKPSFEEDRLLAELAIPRPNARNENVDPRKIAAARDDKGARRAGVSDEDVMTAAGAGVTVVAGP